MEGKEVVATFIVVASFSLYTAILGRPWIHAMGVVPSTLHLHRAGGCCGKRKSAGG